ncbi:MAG: phosphatidylglycerophosphatase A [Deltaproteobacteria bacterium]|nr:phosphatidylglycerophosphatase A [Deltaproteobacteria bacterium]
MAAERPTSDDLAVCLASVFYVGGAPAAPGTWGTLAAVPLWLLLAAAGPGWYLLALLLVTAVGVWAAGVTEVVLGEPDSGAIVIDEVAGFLVTMAWLPVSWPAAVGGFLLFRLFDIGKPFPVSWAERQFKGGLGVMLDDLLAGLLAHLVLRTLLGCW